MGGCVSGSNGKPSGGSSGENAERTELNNNPEAIRDEKIILKFKTDEANMMLNIRKIQAKIDLYEKQIEQKMSSNPTQAKILLHKKRNQQKALKRKENDLKILSNTYNQFDNYKDTKEIIDTLSKQNKIMIQDDITSIIYQAKLDVMEIAESQKQNDKNMKQMANLDREEGYDSDKELEKIRNKKRTPP